MPSKIVECVYQDWWMWMTVSVLQDGYVCTVRQLDGYLAGCARQIIQKQQGRLEKCLCAIGARAQHRLHGRGVAGVRPDPWRSRIRCTPTIPRSMVRLGTRTRVVPIRSNRRYVCRLHRHLHDRARRGRADHAGHAGCNVLTLSVHAHRSRSMTLPHAPESAT